MAVLRPQGSTNGLDFQAVLQVVNKMAAALNEIKTDHNGLCTKLDADAGVSDTNYNATRALGYADIDTISPIG